MPIERSYEKLGGHPLVFFVKMPIPAGNIAKANLAAASVKCGVPFTDYEGSLYPMATYSERVPSEVNSMRPSFPVSLPFFAEAVLSPTPSQVLAKLKLLPKMFTSLAAALDRLALG